MLGITPPALCAPHDITCCTSHAVYWLCHHLGLRCWCTGGTYPNRASQDPYSTETKRDWALLYLSFRWNVSNVPNTLISGLCGRNHLILTTLWTLILLLYWFIKKLRLRGVKWLAQGHTTSKWQENSEQQWLKLLSLDRLMILFLSWSCTL